jgi:leucine dehydrogenase
VANAGGIINVMAEYNQEPHDSVQDRVLRIGERIDAILSQARAERRPADQIADDLARARIAGGARSVA